MKICIKCNIEKPLLEYYSNGGGKYRSQCKICDHIKHKQDYHNNPEPIKYRQRLYNIKYKNIRKKYNSNNRDIINEYDRSYFLKNKDNPTFKIKKNLRSRFYQILKNYNGKKYTSVINLFGCKINELKQHLESQFKPEMNWNNYGKIWEIDHIVPCSSFNLMQIEEQQKCFHYTNLQPLFTTTSIAESFGYKDQIGNRNKLNKLK